MKISLTVLCLCLSYLSFAQPDVLHYRFHLSLNDKDDVIRGKADIRLLNTGADLTFDLAGLSAGKGMLVDSVWATGMQDTVLAFQHLSGQLHIRFAQPSTGVRNLRIQYHGIPRDGLIISHNKFGERTFFSDNWPNRAQQWIPVHDQPFDKASVEFIVDAPARYRVISNGLLQEESMLSTDLKRTHWKETTPLPTKIMVIGLAPFAVKTFTAQGQLPVSAWVYPQDSTALYKAYAKAPSIVQFFSEYIAPFPFPKLANVQSTTIFGGMENAGAIFYTETRTADDAETEGLLAHEIAHQWFGDMASEKSFAHLWLSEGFATWLTHYYFEQRYGSNIFTERMKADREQVIRFARQSHKAVVDSTSDLMSLLNANSYQKGGWVLYMLRTEVGDTVFRKILQQYYQQYKGSNADTRDFEQVAEKLSGKDLRWFFNQWLYQPGVPRIRQQLKVNKGGAEMKLTIEGGNYRLPMEIGIADRMGNLRIQKIWIEGPEFSIKLKSKNIRKLILDPRSKTLFELIRE